jgi:hypothetical protein
VLSGLSRAEAVTAVIPAALTLIGVVAVYVFSTEGGSKPQVGFSIAVFVVALFAGAQNGALRRQEGGEYRLKEAFSREFRMRNFRKNLGLPEYIPAWVVRDERPE